MNQSYWDGLSSGFSTRVFQITDHDTRGVVLSTARRLSGPGKTACDFGCGTGAVTRLVAPLFCRVIGVDYAPRLLHQARRRTVSDNVIYRRANLAARSPLNFRVDAGFCVNALIHRDHGRRERMARRIAGCIRPGGAAVFVVPSLESTLRTYHTVVRCQVREGTAQWRAARSVRDVAKEEMLSFTEGIVRVGGTPTKHYTEDELREFLEDAGFCVRHTRRVEYPWDQELENVPPWLGAPLPWDWLAVVDRL